jgi:predicted aspartyl protease
MGITYVDGLITGPTGKQRSVRLLVDSGAMYTLLPNEDWQAIGLTAKRSERFSLADGTTVTRDVGECHIALPQGAPTRR